MRIGIIREFMVKHAKVDGPIVDAAAAEMKEMLGGHLGATLVESVPAGWVDDPEIENMTTSFDRPSPQLTPVLFPQLLYSVNAAGEPEFPAFAAKIEPTEFAPGVSSWQRDDAAGRLDVAVGRGSGALASEPEPAQCRQCGVRPAADVPVSHDAVSGPAGEGLVGTWPHRDPD